MIETAGNRQGQSAVGIKVDGRRFISHFDLKLLGVIGELNRCRSVSRAAERPDLSQSAISMSLAKLRKFFNDPLFVRTSQGMEPTPCAVQLITIFSQAENLLQTAFDQSAAFDPRTSERVFRLQSTDIAQVILLPRLLQHLREVAPLIRVNLQRLAPDTTKLLEAGELDLAVGCIAPMGAGFCHQRLFKERFVCAARKDHPRIGSTLTLSQFEAESHLAVSTVWTGLGIVEKTIETKRIHRRVALTIPSFLGIAPILQSSDYLVIVPERLGWHLVASGTIKTLSLPFEIPVYGVMQHWHERYAHDPALRWLRKAMASLFQASPEHHAWREPKMDREEDRQ